MDGNINWFSVSAKSMFSHTHHILLINVEPPLSLKPCMGQNGELAQPLSKGASNPASSTQLPSVSGIRETLSPVIYHNDETQL